MLTALLLAALMIASSVAAVILHPGRLPHKSLPPLGLETLVPQRFADWRVDESVVPVLPSPDVQEKLDKIYDETLARTYVNRAGERVMLSIAYGGDQTGRLRVHRPESCYTAQGFLVKQLAVQDVQFGQTAVPVRRLMAQMGARSEPITYWIRVGGETVSSNWGQRLVQLKSGLVGQIPDGLLFRASTIGADPAREYALQDRFLRELFASMPPEQASKLIGSARAAGPAAN